MNSRLHSQLALPIAVAAFFVLLLNPPAAAVAFAVAGTLALLASDYGRTSHPFPAEDRALAFEAPRRAPEQMREAA